jgi:hypothetical protein
VALDPRQFALLQALVKAEVGLREQGRPTDFMLLQMPGPRFGLKPPVEGEGELGPTEADILDFSSEGLVHLLPSTSPTVRAKFALTSAGRSAGQPRAVTADIRRPAPGTAPPSPDEILAWLDGLAASGAGSRILVAGGALMNEALSQFGHETLDTIARRMIDLRTEGLLAFDDPLASIEQIQDAERLSHGGDFRLTSAGRDRVKPPNTASAPSVTQIVLATQAQVAAGDINVTYSSYDELLDRIAEALEALTEIDDAAREEARGILGKLRSASGTIATGASASAGGTVIGGILKGILGLP